MSEATRILLVEDEQHLAFNLSFNLEAEGYQVDVAETLAGARERLEPAPALILLDVMLPDGNGFEFTRELREAENLVPILMLTAKGTPDDIVSGLEAGADDYLTKPFELTELTSRIAAMLRRRAWETQRLGPVVSTGQGRYEFSGNEIDFEKRQASSRDKTVRLTDLELRLMQYFIEHENEPISREQLLETVWELPPATNTRTVDNFLVRLRRLFEEDPASPRHFLTVRGVGYRFVSSPEDG